MYVWELIACRLRVDGWQVWHNLIETADGPSYAVALRRPGCSCEVVGLTLTDAYAAAARRARQHACESNAGAVARPHFSRAAAFATV